MSNLVVFGSLHVDRPGKVKSELSTFCREADVIFVEAPRDPVTKQDKRAVLLRNPVMWMTGWILDVVWAIAGFLLSKGKAREPVDGYVTDVVAEEHGIDIEPVDLNLMRRASDVNRWLTAVSWIWAAFAIVIFASGLVTLSVSLVIWAVVIAFSPVAPFAYLTLTERDALIAANIQDILSTRNDIEKACLIVGRRHMSGILDELSETELTVEETHTSKFLRRAS
jgi:hypothetical protein